MIIPFRWTPHTHTQNTPHTPHTHVYEPQDEKQREAEGVAVGGGVGHAVGDPDIAVDGFAPFSTTTAPLDGLFAFILFNAAYHATHTHTHGEISVVCGVSRV